MARLRIRMRSAGDRRLPQIQSANLVRYAVAGSVIDLHIRRDPIRWPTLAFQLVLVVYERRWFSPLIGAIASIPVNPAPFSPHAPLSYFPSCQTPLFYKDE